MIALLIGYSFLNKRSSSTPDRTTAAETTYIMVTETDADDIEAISYTTEEGDRLSFIRVDGKWKSADDEKMPLEQTIIDQMVSASATIGATRKIEEGLTNASDYGLDKPVLVVELSYSNDKKVTYTIGETNPYSNEVYFAVSDDDAVYTVNDIFCSFFDYTINELILLDKMATIDKKEIESVIVTTKLGTRQLLSEKDEDSEDKTWKIVNESEEQTALEEQTANDLLTALLSLKLDNCINYDASEEELAPYGLDEPVVVTINYKRQKTVSPNEQNPSTGSVIIDLTYKIDIGYDNEGKSYVKLEDSSMVFDVDLSKIELLLKDIDQTQS